MLVSIIPTEKSIVVGSEFLLAGSGIASIIFADGTVWAKADFASIIAADAGIHPSYHVPAGARFSPSAGSQLILGEVDGAQIGVASNAYDEQVIWTAASGTATARLVAPPSGAGGSVLELVDLDPSQVTLTREADAGGDDLVVSNNLTGKTLTFLHEFSTSDLASIRFMDGTTLDSAGIVAAAWYRAGPGDVKLTAGAGDLTVLAGSGNDTLVGGSGNNTLIAATGDDVLVGGQGNDTFVYAAVDGNLTIDDTAWWTEPTRSNTLKLADLNAADLTLSRDTNNDLIVTIIATGRTIIVTGNFNSADRDGVQQIAFANGTTWNRDQITAAAPVRKHRRFTASLLVASV